MRRWIAAVALTVASVGVVSPAADAAPAQAQGGDNCWTKAEYDRIGNTDSQRRHKMEREFGIAPIHVNDKLFDGNQVWDPKNPNLYVRAYNVCGFDPMTEFIAVCVFRRGSDMWFYCYFGIRTTAFTYPWDVARVYAR